MKKIFRHKIYASKFKNLQFKNTFTIQLRLGIISKFRLKKVKVWLVEVECQINCELYRFMSFIFNSRNEI